MPVLTPLQAANESLRTVLAPALPFLLRLPLPAGVKSDLMVRPVDAFLNLFMPLEDFFAETVSLATHDVAEGAGSFSTRLPMSGMVVDLRVDGVPGAKRTVDEVTPQTLRRTTTTVDSLLQVNNIMLPGHRLR